MCDFGIVDISTRVRNEVEKTIEGELFKAAAEIGVSVDRIRLFKALTEARMFYDDGYEAGLRDAVRHGTWETVLSEQSGRLNLYTHACPKCKYVYKVFKPIGHNFCPNCGVKMDGGESDGKTD